MMRIALIVLYFGNLPKYFEVFEYTLSYNPNIDCLFFTDQEVERPPRNLHVIRCSFQEIQKRMQDKFPFPIVLDKPYKLCDYRPAFGFVFQQELKGYDFWGHCDIDIVMGDILKFLPESTLQKYDKLYQLGHLCLYKNSDENNVRFMLDGGMDHRQVFQTKINCIFDEKKGIELKFRSLGIPTYISGDCADISPKYHNFQLAIPQEYNFPTEYRNYKYQLFYWENGKVFRAFYKNKQIKTDEFNYLHFQKRVPKLYMDDVSCCNAFYLTPKGFIPKTEDVITLKQIKKYNRPSIIRNFFAICKYKYFIWKRRILKFMIAARENKANKAG